MAIAMSAAAKYWRRDRSAIRGDLRRSCCVAVGAVGAGSGSGGGLVGLDVGAGIVGARSGLFARVCRRCTRGAVRRTCLAVGLVEE